MIIRSVPLAPKTYPMKFCVTKDFNLVAKETCVPEVIDAGSPQVLSEAKMYSSLYLRLAHS